MSGSIVRVEVLEHCDEQNYKSTPQVKVVEKMLAAGWKNTVSHPTTSESTLHRNKESRDMHRRT